MFRSLAAVADQPEGLWASHTNVYLLSIVIKARGQSVMEICWCNRVGQTLILRSSLSGRRVARVASLHLHNTPAPENQTTHLSLTPTCRPEDEKLRGRIARAVVQGTTNPQPVGRLEGPGWPKTATTDGGLPLTSRASDAVRRSKSYGNKSCSR